MNGRQLAAVLLASAILWGIIGFVVYSVFIR